MNTTMRATVIGVSAFALSLQSTRARAQPPEPSPSSDAVPAASTTTSADAPPKKLLVAESGSLRFGSLLQFWAFGRQQDDVTETTFRIRRAEFKLSGEIVPKRVGYLLMVDPAKVLESEDTTVEVEDQEPAPVEPGTVTVEQPGDKLSVLQDVAVTFSFDYGDLWVGQFKNGLSYEGFNSSSTLIFPERAPVSRAYGDQRDIGLSLRKEFEHVGYFVGLFNGTGLNLRDTDNQKALALRVEAYPFTGALLGAVGYTSLGERDLPGTQDRVELDARLEHGDVLVQAEYLSGWDGPAGDRVHGHGFYGAMGYTFVDVLQPVLRVGHLDPELGADGVDDADELMHYDVGLNYYLLGKHARLSASASFFSWDDQPRQTDLILLAQGSF